MRSGLKPEPSQGLTDDLAAQIQLHSDALDAGLCHPDEVREKLVFRSYLSKPIDDLCYGMRNSGAKTITVS